MIQLDNLDYHWLKCCNVQKVSLKVLDLCVCICLVIYSSKTMSLVDFNSDSSPVNIIKAGTVVQGSPCFCKLNLPCGHFVCANLHYLH